MRTHIAGLSMGKILATVGLILGLLWLWVSAPNWAVGVGGHLQGGNPQNERIPTLDLGDRTKSVVVVLKFDGPNQVSLASAKVVLGRPHVRIGDPPLLRIRLLDMQSNLLEEFNAWDPLWTFAYYEKTSFPGKPPITLHRLVILDSAEGRFILPFSCKLNTMEVMDVESKAQLIKVELQPVIQLFLQQHPEEQAKDCPSAPPIVLPPPPPPPAGGTVPLKQFDLNSNDLIDDPEFFTIIDAWVAEQVDDPTFFDAIDLWVSQQPISLTGSKLEPLSLNTVIFTINPARSSATFRAQGRGIAFTRVGIYDLSGRQIFTDETAGSQLVWSLSTSDGQPAANGVYLYVVTMRGTNGRTLQSDVKKLVILR